MKAMGMPVLFGRQAPLQQPAKCRCNDLQNRFATTYIFVLQLYTKNACKKQSGSLSLEVVTGDGSF